MRYHFGYSLKAVWRNFRSVENSTGGRLVENKWTDFSNPPIEGFLSLCELTMSLSSHWITVIFEESSRSDIPMSLSLSFFSSSLKYLSWAANSSLALICYTGMGLMSLLLVDTHKDRGARIKERWTLSLRKGKKRKPMFWYMLLNRGRNRCLETPL